MVLVCDIGNTNITIGVFKRSRLIFKAKVSTDKYKQLCRLPELKKFSRIEAAVICSVVPKINRAVEKELEAIFSKPIYILGKNPSVPIINLYAKPRQVGQDRLVNAYAGVELYGAPLVVVDFGTAVTFDVVSKNKEYLGGMILPGLEMSLEALAKKTALLPKIKLEKPKGLIGRDTKSSMLNGIVYGFAALTDDLALRIKEKIGKDTLVVGTGGNIGLIGRYCKRIDKIDENLTLKGLNMIYVQTKMR